MNKKNKASLKYMRFIPLAIMIALGVVFVIFRDKITIKSIADVSPEHIVLAVLFLVALYALKSLSVMFPVAVLMAAGGYIFSTGVGILVNVLGVAACISVLYWLGRLTSLGTNENILEKYPKVNRIVSVSRTNPFAASLFSRTLFFLPCDIISLYMGTIKMNYFKYLTGGVLGFLPMTISTTVLGKSMTNPKSPAFIISGCVNLSITLVSVFIYWIISKRKQSAH